MTWDYVGYVNQSALFCCMIISLTQNEDFSIYTNVKLVWTCEKWVISDHIENDWRQLDSITNTLCSDIELRANVPNSQSQRRYQIVSDTVTVGKLTIDF